MTRTLSGRRLSFAGPIAKNAFNGAKKMEPAKKLPTVEILECGHPESPHSSFTRGYGTNDKGERHCYDCCTDQDLSWMKDKGRIALYLVPVTQQERTEGKAPYSASYSVTNWLGHIFAFVRRSTKGRHNIARTRIDVWFPHDGYMWHGVQYGEMTQIVHCRRTKEKVNG